jgi:two-component system response regulator AtoC
VFTVGDGEEAIAALGEHHIDVLITDLRMPKLDGMRLLAHCSASTPTCPWS